jgi:hypothetical protein
MDDARLTTLLLALAYALVTDAAGDADSADAAPVDTASRVSALRLSTAQRLIGRADAFSLASPHAVHAALLVASEGGDLRGALAFVKAVVESGRACAAPAASSPTARLLHVLAGRTARSTHFTEDIDDHLSLLALCAALPCAEDQRFSPSLAGNGLLELARALLTSAVSCLAGARPSDALAAVVSLRLVIGTLATAPLLSLSSYSGVDFFSPPGIAAPAVTEASAAAVRERRALMNRRSASQRAVDTAYVARALALSDVAGVSISRLISHVSRYVASSPVSAATEDVCRGLVANSDGLVAELLDSLSAVGR